MLDPQEDDVAMPYGFVGAPSTATEISVTSYLSKKDTPIIGQMVYTDQSLDDGYIYRSLGTVTQVTTNNPQSADPQIIAALAKDVGNTLPMLPDSKSLTMKIQATYRSTNGETEWEQVGTGLLSSPSTMSGVHILDETALASVLGDDINGAVYLGDFRGLTGVHMPMKIPGFSSRRGATHQCIAGRSGSGKTGLGHTLLAAQMRNEQHAIVVVDPQGQWSSESGFLFSLQSFARNLGREVTVLRVSEDIKLPMSEDLLSHMMTELDLWRALTRMAAENKEFFSDEVAKQIVSYMRSHRDESPTPKDILLSAFYKISTSPSILGRVYSRGGDAGENLKMMLGAISDAPITDKNGEPVEFSDADRDDAEETLRSVMQKFTPLINLFLQENLNGGVRKSLGGDRGFLSRVLRARSEGEVAPYVVLDMSSDVTLNARDAYAKATAADEDEDVSASRQMRVMLDNPDVKAHIVSTVLNEVVKRAEIAFAQGGANLDTQIVFDEAWRYAPNPSTVPRGSAIHALTDKLAGYALDTRKYGVGWSYILQSPEDLNPTIWRQLTYIWAGHGMIGSDRNMLSDRMDDSMQMRLYDQFADPSATGVYPFMALGPVNPLIFTSAPSFINVFSSPQEFLSANSSWINDICQRRSLMRFTHDANTIGFASVPAPTKKPVQAAGRSATNRGIGESGVEAIREFTIEKPPF